MIPELIFNILFIVLAAVSFYYINLGNKFEGDFDKKVLNFFSLGIFFVLVKGVASIAVILGVTTFLLSAKALYVYDLLIAICFLLGSYFVKDLILTSE